ncbi:hypothetical protein Rsub_13429, partial [Raphidocelis subcapitata]
MVRLMAAEMLPEHGIVLYLDMDVMVVSSLDGMWQGAACGRKFPAKRGRGTPLCAKSSLRSNIVKWMSADASCYLDVTFIARDSLRSNIVKWMSADASCYLDVTFIAREFNAGVMLMDLAHMRTWGVSAFSVYLSRWFALNDQAILNLYTNATYAELAPEWNVYYRQDDQRMPANRWRI